LWDINIKVLLFKIYSEMVAEVARKAHNLEVGGSIPSLATKKKLHKKFGKLKSLSYLCETFDNHRNQISLSVIIE
jgi:hypothetical protein